MATVEELQDELRNLRAEMHQLRQQVAPADPARQSLTRRNLLRAAPVVAVGGAIAAMSSGSAAASPGNPVIMGAANDAGTTSTSLTGGAAGTDALVVDGGLSADEVTVVDGLKSVTLSDDPQDGVHVAGIPLIGGGPAFTVTGYVQPGGGEANGWDAVAIDGQGGGTGVTVSWGDLGESIGPPNPHSPGTAMSLVTQTCDALTIETEQGHAVAAKVTDSACAIDAMTVSYAGTSRALYAESTSTTNINGTITGVNDGHGIGVWGEQRNDVVSGFGLVGVGGAKGRGARLSGGAAALQMLPSAAATHPTTGKAGDFFVDHSTRLWFCTQASSGSTAAVWKRLA